MRLLFLEAFSLLPGCRMRLLLSLFHSRSQNLTRQSLAKQKLGASDLPAGLWVLGCPVWRGCEGGRWVSGTKALALSTVGVTVSCYLLFCSNKQ